MSGADRPRQIRRLAFELLFQFDAIGAPTIDDAQAQLTLESSDTASTLNEGGRSRALKLASGAWAAKRAIDDLIANLSPTWPAHRMPATDRAIIRLAIHEMKQGGVTPAVAINEAVDLARAFGTEKSASFVNSILDDAKAALTAPAPPISQAPSS